MPATYNGIGTRYVGKKNADSRPAVCPHCHRNTVLTSYDTRLWFVIFFIPVIPLARKRIINQCPSCRRHYVMPLDQWEAGKQLSISGAMEEYRTDPSPEKSIAAHRQLLGYHQTSQAEEFGRTMAGEYTDNATVQLYLGDASSHIGKYADAAGFYRRALDLRPDLPEARIAVAAGRRNEGRLDEARQLLDFLEKPGAARVYSAVPLELLANAFQAARQPLPALELYEIVLREVPSAAQHAGFRKRVRQTEKSANRQHSMLPKRKFTFRSLFGGEKSNLRTLTILGVAAGLIAVAMLAGNFYIRGHRKLFLVNGYAQPATVQITGQPAVPLAPHGQSQLVLPEGHYHAVVTRPGHEEFDFDLRADYLSRWFSKPAWVLNPGGQAVLIFERAYYSKNAAPTQYSFATGEGFVSYPEVDHPFEPLPASVQMSSNEHTRVLTKLDYARGNALAVLQDLVDDKRYDEAIRLYEARLRHGSDEPGLVAGYLAAATRYGHLDRATDVLRQGLSRRPVNVAWHRAYQNTVLRQEKGSAQLRGEYTALLAEHPDDSMLLYLRGRVGEQKAEEESYFQRAAAADPKNGWPLFGLAYNRALAGDWNGTRSLAEEAYRLDPKSAEMEQLFFEARLALNETAALEKEERAHLVSIPLDGLALYRLTDVLDAANRPGESRTELEHWTAEIHRADKQGSWAEEGLSNVRRKVFYSLGDFADSQAEGSDEKTEGAMRSRVEALIEQGDLEAAGGWLSRFPAGDDTADYLLALSVAHAAQGNAAAAADYRQRAQKAFRSLGSYGAGPAAVLSKTSAPPLADFETMDLSLEEKKLLLTSCALQYRPQAAAYARLASTLNVSRAFPHHLIQRVTQPLIR